MLIFFFKLDVEIVNAYVNSNHILWNFANIPEHQKYCNTFVVLVILNFLRCCIVVIVKYNIDTVCFYFTVLDFKDQCDIEAHPCSQTHKNIEMLRK